MGSVDTVHTVHTVHTMRSKSAVRERSPSTAYTRLESVLEQRARVPEWAKQQLALVQELVL